MLKSSRILVPAFIITVSTVMLVGCGQRGPLYLPTGPATAKRATLPETLAPRLNIDQANPTTPTPKSYQE
ncbi:MAG: lipoprotein [Burkholderiaceae bacterium]|nr:lipoprotein [Burkholderiaceae bacterium]